jgi:hypothetical protein
MLVYEPPHGRFSLSSADASLEYALSLDRLKIEPAVSYFYWSSDEAPRSTVEASLKVSYKLGEFRAVSGNYVDVKTSPGAYFGTLGGEYERLFRRWGINASLNVGWATADYNKAYLARDIVAVDVVEGGLSVRYSITSILYFTIHAEASTLVALTIQRSVQEPTLVNGGTNLGIDY